MCVCIHAKVCTCVFVCLWRSNGNLEVEYLLLPCKYSRSNPGLRLSRSTLTPWASQCFKFYCLLGFCFIYFIFCTCNFNLSTVASYLSLDHSSHFSGIFNSLSKLSQVILCDAGSGSDLQLPVSHTAARGMDAMPCSAVSLQYDAHQARVIKYPKAYCIVSS